MIEIKITEKEIDEFQLVKNKVQHRCQLVVNEMPDMLRRYAAFHGKILKNKSSKCR